MAPQRPTPPPPLATYRPSNERGPGAGQQFPPRTMPPGGGGRQRPPAARKRGGGFLRGLLYMFLLALIVAGAGVGYLILNPPSDLIRQTIADKVKEKTGRDLVVAGQAAFSFYPGLGVSLHDVSLSGPPGSTGKLVKMVALDVNIKTMPLINRQVEIRRLILKQPVFDFRVDKQGKKNWNFAEIADPVRYAQAGEEQPATDAPADTPASRGIRLPSKLSDIEHLQLDDVRVEDGTFRFTDERTGKVQQVTAANLKVALKSLSNPIVANGDFAWQGEKIAFDGKLSTAKTLLEERPSKLTFTASNRHLDANYDGAVLIKDGADFEGQVTAKSASAKALAKWLGTDLPPVQGFGPLSLTGTFKTNGNVTSVSNANFGLDGATAVGGVTVTTGGVRPHVQANLKLSELDLNKYMAGGAPIATTAPEAVPAKKPAAAAPSPAEAPGAAPTEAPAAGDAIENLLNAPGGKVYGATQRAGWSSEAINLALLGVADADAKLQVGRLLFQDIKVGQSALTVALKNKIMKTNFDDVQLYDGHGKGFINVDATDKVAAIGANFALDGVSALPFLKDAANLEWLSGKAKLGVQLAATGASQLQLVESLNGNADFAFANGAIVGFNLPGAIRGISQGKFSGLKKTPAEKTDFSELSATFTIANGVAQNQDLSLVSPLLRVSGGGAVQLPPRTVDYTVKPKIVASLEGQQGDKGLSGLEIPVRISGAWDKPKYEPDLGGVLKDPSKAVEAVKELSKQFKGKNAGEIVNDLLGKKSGDGATGSSSGAKELLNKFLKQQ